ncbi:helix-turn-helix domain-containing protein [Burkholderia pseudomultivorans]|uniref:helix-turn-helix domain-containing protein n=1 Tax=Burkholderia pseudomultivorans TaxID=1207504 RepID=UPI000ACD4C0B
MANDTEITMTLERGLQVLSVFHAERIPLTNGELLRRTELPRSVVSRLTYPYPARVHPPRGKQLPVRTGCGHIRYR